MKEIMYNECAKDLLEALPKSVFLSVATDKEDNVMTIGWASVGYVWGKPVMMVMVRYSRHTYKLIEEADSFTVSVPVKADLKKELGICGSKSGRDYDKWKEAGLTKLSAHKVSAPLVGECDLHYECKILTRQPLDESQIVEESVKPWYDNNDYHVLYYGEIVGTYLK